MRVVRGFPAVVVALGALVVALVALVVALGGIAVGQAGSRRCRRERRDPLLRRPGRIAARAPHGESCHSGERPLLLRAAAAWSPRTPRLPSPRGPASPGRSSGTGGPPSRPTRWPRAATPSPAPSGSTITAGWTGTRGPMRAASPQRQAHPRLCSRGDLRKGDAGDTVLPISVTIDRMRPAGSRSPARRSLVAGAARRPRRPGAGSPGVISATSAVTDRPSDQRRGTRSAPEARLWQDLRQPVGLSPIGRYARAPVYPWFAARLAAGRLSSIAGTEIRAARARSVPR